MSKLPDLVRAASHLDDALEYLTMESFAWSVEEAIAAMQLCVDFITSSPPGTLVASSAAATHGDCPAAPTLSVPRFGSRAPLDAIRCTLEELHGLQAALQESLGDGASGDLREVTSAAVFGALALFDALAESVALRRDQPPCVGVDPLGGRASRDQARGGQPPPQVGATSFDATAGSAGWRMDRRAALRVLAAGSVLPAAACVLSDGGPSRAGSAAVPTTAQPREDVHPEPTARVRDVVPLEGMQWPTTDPFLFCAYHVDAYPAGDAAMGPAASLAGRRIGRDFEGRDNWRMYHGTQVPGFPRHPHRGFETVTVVRRGMLDHADSVGATARYGEGDVQWLTAGTGLQHAEMFPLLRSDADNPLELFQLWLNLPARDKRVPAYFTMMWSEDIPRVVRRDAAGRRVELVLSAGAFEGVTPPSPPPNSWASRAESDVAIWSITMDAGARFTLPSVGSRTERTLYVHRGEGVLVGERSVVNRSAVSLAGPLPVVLQAGPQAVEILLLQGVPIGESVARRGPFVMNTADEIREAYEDFQRTQFGGWPWREDGPVHPREQGRFARHMDGRLDVPG